MPTSEEAATAAAAELLNGDEAQVEPESGSETTDEVEFPTFDIEIPPDLAAELEEDEVDLTVTDDELDALSEETGEVDREVLKRLHAAEARAAHFEQLRVKEAKKNWSEEAKQFFPLAEPFLDEIQATSRRGYLRTAKNVHERMKPIVEEKVLKPAREAIEQEKTKAKEEAEIEARAAWGQPLHDDANRPTPEALVSLESQQRRQRRGELSDTIRGMLFTKKES